MNVIKNENRLLQRKQTMECQQNVKIGQFAEKLGLCSITSNLTDSTNKRSMSVVKRTQIVTLTLA